MRLFLIKISLLTIFCLCFLAESSYAQELLKNSVISKDKTLSGRVLIEGKVVVEKGATLKIEPGTQILFKYLDADNDGISETSLWIYGNILAKGTKDRRIVFTSYEKDKKWGDWKEIQINHVKGFVFEHVEIQYSEYGIHVHFSEGEIRNSFFRYNNDCTRLGNSRITFTNNLFEKNSGKALNFTNCNILFKNNVVRDNREGIFVFEKAGNVNIRNNNVYNNFRNVKTGDFFKEKLILGENYIYPIDNIEGNVTYKLLDEPIYGILPDDKNAYAIFSIETNGYVDGGGLVVGDKLFFPSFDGNIYEYDLKNNILKKFFLNDFNDAIPIVFNNKLFYQTWGGEIGFFDLISGEKRHITFFDKTLKDDHRNPSPVLFENRAIFLSPGGSLVVVDLVNLKELFRTKIDDEFRANPLILDNFLYLLSTSGKIYRISLENLDINQKTFNDSFYSSLVVFDKHLVAVSKEGTVYFLNKDLSISKSVNLKSSFRYQSPISYRNELYFFSLDGKIFKLNNNGEVTLLKEIDEIFTSTPTLYKDFIVVPGFYGNLYFYKDDEIIKISNLGEIQFSPLTYGDVVITGSRSNRVYGIKIW